jgi:putative transposase
MIMDVYSRKIVGWAIHEKESQEYAAELIEMTCIMEGVSKHTLYCIQIMEVL